MADDGEITIEGAYTGSTKFRLYTVTFFGTPISVTVTSNPSAVSKWVRKTVFFHRRRREPMVVGTGVQWTAFHGSSSPAQTLHLCVGTRCLIFQLYRADRVPLSLRKFLYHTGNTFVGLWNGSDQRKLYESEHVVGIHDLLDLRKYAEADDGRSLRGASAEDIVRETLGYEGVRLEKEISLSDWGRRDLGRDQVMQACVDAYVSFRIGRDLRAWEL
ncbi:unnamed protein product [Linum trigynum]|uniref:3'-5' exonuclease domain-containing protein n=1 Tax=Linum trigynum TaxID=586398 RepID=A0AAV2DP00_9ROSI